jgi:hypothetical protein
LLAVPAIVAERQASNGFVRTADRNLSTGFIGRNERKTRGSVPEQVCFASPRSPTTIFGRGIIAGELGIC